MKIFRKKFLLSFLLIFLFLFLLVFIYTSHQIGTSVLKYCRLAQAQYPGDCVEALSQQLNDPANSFADRNSAVWALGQLGDSRALPVLESHYTGQIPSREPWNGTLSQYELKKALKLARGSFNATAFFWRYRLP